MGWLGRLWRRRRAPKHAADRRHRPGSWGQVALPPPVPADPTASSVVRLGFADGTSVDIDDSSRQAAAFRNVAARLIDDADTQS